MLDSWIGSIEIRAAAFQQDEDRFRQVLEGELDHLRDQALDEYEQCGLFSEAEVDYPRPIRHSESTYTRSEERQFSTRWGADRWIARKKRAYEKYVLRLIREGVYDSYGYER